jgi:hypothetical protein
MRSLEDVESLWLLRMAKVGVHPMTLRRRAVDALTG